MEVTFFLGLFRSRAKMAYNGVNISIPVKFDIKTAPLGMIDYDPKALSADQQTELNSYKLYIRRDNFIYLVAHPEVQAIVSMVLRAVRIHMPRDIIQFVAKLFTRPERQIREEIDKILNEPALETDTICYSDYEEWDY